MSTNSKTMLFTNLRFSCHVPISGCRPFRDISVSPQAHQHTPWTHQGNFPPQIWARLLRSESTSEKENEHHVTRRSFRAKGLLGSCLDLFIKFSLPSLLELYKFKGEFESRLHVQNTNLISSLPVANIDSHSGRVLGFGSKWIKTESTGWVTNLYEQKIGDIICLLSYKQQNV